MYSARMKYIPTPFEDLDPQLKEVIEADLKITGYEADEKYRPSQLVDMLIKLDLEGHFINRIDPNVQERFIQWYIAKAYYEKSIVDDNYKRLIHLEEYKDHLQLDFWKRLAGLFCDAPDSAMRKHNLRNIMRASYNGTYSSLAKAAKRNPSYFSRLLNPHNRYLLKFGETLARSIEGNLGLGYGELDTNVVQKSTDDIYRELAEKQTIAISPTSLAIEPVPLLPWEKAGDGKYFRANLDDIKEFVICPARKYSENTFALRVRGDAMHPEFNDGDIIFVDPGEFPSTDDFGIFQPGGRNTPVMLRQLAQGEEGTYLRATNPNWPNPIIIDIDQGILIIIGTVIAKSCLYTE